MRTTWSARCTGSTARAVPCASPTTTPPIPATPPSPSSKRANTVQRRKASRIAATQIQQAARSGSDTGSSRSLGTVILWTGPASAPHALRHAPHEHQPRVDDRRGTWRAARKVDIYAEIRVKAILTGISAAIGAPRHGAGADRHDESRLRHREIGLA